MAQGMAHGTAQAPPTALAADLLRASASGDVRQVRKLLKRVPPAAPHIFAAVQSGVKQAVVLLAAANRELCNATQANGSTPLYMATTAGNSGIVAAILEYSHDAAAIVGLRTAGSTCLLVACERGYAEIVERLLAAGADATAAAQGPDGNGATPLHVACQHGHAPIVTKLLLALAQHTREADTREDDDAADGLRARAIDAVCSNGATPLYVACRHGHTPIVEALLAAGATVNACTASGASPLLAAVCEGNATIVALLCAHGADPDSENKDGQTPLIAACRAGGWQIAMTEMVGVGSPGEHAERPQLAIPKLLLRAG